MNVKRFTTLLIVLVLMASFGVVAQQESTSMSDQLAAVAIRQDGPQDSLKIGPNMVNVVVRHCDPYVKMFSDREEAMAECAKDPSTVFYNYTSHNLKTTGGIDAIASQLANTGTQAAAGNYMALSTDSTAPAAGDCAAGSVTCTLTSEAASNGLSRKQGTYAHTNGASTYTLTATWTDTTATTSNVQKAAVFNASSSGTMVFENTFTAVTLNVNDQIQVTWTITIS